MKVQHPEPSTITGIQTPSQSAIHDPIGLRPKIGSRKEMIQGPSRLQVIGKREAGIRQQVVAQIGISICTNPQFEVSSLQRWLLMSFPEYQAEGLPRFRGLRNGGPPGSPIPASGENSGGGRHHPSVTFRNEQAGSFGMKKRASATTDSTDASFWVTARNQMKGEIETLIAFVRCDRLG